MKTLFLTLIFCLFNLTTFEITGKYQIESEMSYDTLELKKNGTYLYESRGDSCWTWTDITGTWELKDGILTLNHTYSFEEDATQYVEQIEENSDDSIIFEVKDNFDKPIADFELKYWCANNHAKKTDKNGIVKFDKCSQIESDGETVSVGIEYSINGNTYSESSQVYKKSNYIILTINSQSQTINKKEKYRFEYLNGKLKSIDFPYVGGINTYKKL